MCQVGGAMEGRGGSGGVVGSVAGLVSIPQAQLRSKPSIIEHTAYLRQLQGFESSLLRFRVCEI